MNVPNSRCVSHYCYYSFGNLENGQVLFVIKFGLYN